MLAKQADLEAKRDIPSTRTIALDKTHLQKITSVLPPAILSWIDFYQILPLQMCMSMGHQASVITAAHLRGKR